MNSAPLRKIPANFPVWIRESGLTTRTINLLAELAFDERHGLKLDFAEPEALIRRRLIAFVECGRTYRIRNAGQATQNELVRWLGCQPGPRYMESRLEEYVPYQPNPIVMKERFAKLRAALEDIHTTAHCISKAGPANTPTLADAWAKFDQLSVEAGHALWLDRKMEAEQ